VIRMVQKEGRGKAEKFFRKEGGKCQVGTTILMRGRLSEGRRVHVERGGPYTKKGLNVSANKKGGEKG